MPRLNESFPEAEAVSSPPGGADPSRAHVDRLIAGGGPIALFLDIDGTLLDVALTPSTVHVPPKLAELLESVATRLAGALAIVTGRQLEEADRLLQPSKFVAAGVHGAQMRLSPSGRIERLASGFNAGLVEEIKEIVQSLPGVVFEDKGSGIALHYRLAPELEGSLLLVLNGLADRHPGQFRICGGRKVVELLPVGFSKGRAVREIVSLPQFADRTPIMIGDDVSDIDAFRAVEDLRGFGLKVAGENFSSLESSFEGPADVLDWLRNLSRPR